MQAGNAILRNKPRVTYKSKYLWISVLFGHIYIESPDMRTSVLSFVMYGIFGYNSDSNFFKFVFLLPNHGGLLIFSKVGLPLRFPQLTYTNWLYRYPPFPLLSYFSVVVCPRCLLHHILSLIAYTFRENREFVFIIIVQFLISANIRIRFGLQIVLVCLYSTPSHYHHCANLSEGIELIKCLSDIFCRVCE